MKTLKKNELLEGLADYGYPLMRPVRTWEPEELLGNLLRQEDPRLLEGFPVVLLNLLRERQALAWEAPKWDPAHGLSRPAQERLVCLLSLGYLLFKLFGVESSLVRRTERLLSRFKGWKEKVRNLEPSFTTSGEVKAGGLSLSVERMKNQFRDYVLYHPESEEAKKKKHELELELLLSELFTPRQKELLRKRLEGKPFTKTEREYFYRVVKKRLKALASGELHQLARSLLV